MKVLAIMALTALLLTGLAGCGQKGPLYLPDDAPVTKPSDEQPSQPSE